MGSSGWNCPFLEYGNELYNRNFNISGLLDEEKVDIGNAKVDIESILSKKKVEIPRQKQWFISIDFLKSLALIRYWQKFSYGAS